MRDDASVTRRRLAIALPAGLALLAFAAVAHARTYDIPWALGASLKRTDADTPLAILVPSKLALDYGGHAYASGFGGSRSYSLTLGGAPRCSANACFLASFGAQRGGKPNFRTKVRLRDGHTGWFKPLTCEGSCSPPVIQWRALGNLYTIQAKIPDSDDAGAKRRLVAAANSALAAGPR